MAPVPNMPGALWTPPVNANTPNTEGAYVDSLPPWDVAILTADTTYQLSSIRENILGGYSPLDFKDPRVLKLVIGFKKRLAEIEKEIAERDASRFLTFPFLLPSQIPNSLPI